MLEFKENRPDRPPAPAALKVAVALALLLCAALVVLLVPRLLRGKETTHPEDACNGEPLSEEAVAAMFGPPDEWVLARVAEIDVPTVANLSPLVEAAPNSLVLLRYLAAIVNPRAASAVVARVIELSPRFTRPPTSFGSRILWRGSRLAQSRDAAAPQQMIRHHFAIPDDAARLFRDCRVETRYIGFGGEALAADDFAPRDAAFTVVSFSDTRDAVELFVERPLPEAVSAIEGGWALELGVTVDGRTLLPEDSSAEAPRARIDFLE